MRRNSHDIRYFRYKDIKGRRTYYWIPPRSLWKTGNFRFVTLGTDLSYAKAEAEQWNKKLEAYRGRMGDHKPKLVDALPGTAAHLARSFEASVAFSRYALRTQQDYKGIYRRVETLKFGGRRMFGDLPVRQITKQMACRIYEHYKVSSGVCAANKIASAWHAAFRYGMRNVGGARFNPFSQLGKHSPPPRRQRWTHAQLEAFIQKADELGFPSIGRCALMCMELVQRPGDILSLTWAACSDHLGLWHIHQSKRGAEVWIPPTRRLGDVLESERWRLRSSNGNDIDHLLVCPTKTGKRWQRRNFTKSARLIARAAGIPDDLQIRDLRRTGATEGASAGATAWEMMAVGGWQHPSSIRPYFVHTSEQAAAFQEKREAYRLLQMNRRQARV
jgi:hypothetical protein